MLKFLRQEHDISTAETIESPEVTLSRSEQKRQDILAAAHRAFLENGYDAVSMDAIAERAHVSKRTVYSHFGSKEELFAGIMRSECEAKTSIMQANIDASLPIDVVLTNYGVDFLTMMFDPEVTALLRILISKAEQMEELGREFFAEGPEQSIAEMGRYLNSQKQKGVIQFDDADFTAASFMSSMLGANHIKVLATTMPPPDAAEIEWIVKDCVGRFLDGVLAR